MSGNAFIEESLSETYLICVRCVGGSFSCSFLLRCVLLFRDSVSAAFTACPAPPRLMLSAVLGAFFILPSAMSLATESCQPSGRSEQWLMRAIAEARHLDNGDIADRLDQVQVWTWIGYYSALCGDSEGCLEAARFSGNRYAPECLSVLSKALAMRGEALAAVRVADTESHPGLRDRTFADIGLVFAEQHRFPIAKAILDRIADDHIALTACKSVLRQQTYAGHSDTALAWITEWESAGRMDSNDAFDMRDWVIQARNARRLLPAQDIQKSISDIVVGFSLPLRKFSLAMSLKDMTDYLQFLDKDAHDVRTAVLYVIACRYLELGQERNAQDALISCLNQSLEASAEYRFACPILVAQQQVALGDKEAARRTLQHLMRPRGFLLQAEELQVCDKFSVQPTAISVLVALGELDRAWEVGMTRWYPNIMEAESLWTTGACMASVGEADFVERSSSKIGHAQRAIMFSGVACALLDGWP